MSNNAVNSVVANLIRAAAGSSAKNVSDLDVDKYVADLILKEAEEKRNKYKQVGVQAYQPNGLPKKPKPKPNTRFLLNVVKATDSHNQFVIKANEDNVAKLREERLQREREEREKRRHREDRYGRSERSRREHRRSSKDDRRSNKDDKYSSHKSNHDDKKRDRNSLHKKSSSDQDNSDDSIHIERLRDSSSSNDVQYKGRGKFRINVSSMDKYFSKGYNPLLDIDSDKEEYVGTKRKHKEHRKHKDDKKKKESKKKESKKKKKKKHHSPSSSSSSSSSEEKEETIKPIRAWDVGKV